MVCEPDLITIGEAMCFMAHCNQVRFIYNTNKLLFKIEISAMVSVSMPQPLRLCLIWEIINLLWQTFLSFCLTLSASDASPADTLRGVRLSRHVAHVYMFSGWVRTCFKRCAWKFENNLWRGCDVLINSATQEWLWVWKSSKLETMCSQFWNKNFDNAMRAWLDFKLLFLNGSVTLLIVHIWELNREPSLKMNSIQWKDNCVQSPKSNFTDGETGRKGCIENQQKNSKRWAQKASSVRVWLFLNLIWSGRDLKSSWHQSKFISIILTLRYTFC